MAITMLAGYLVIINAAALLMMAEDKRRAKRHQWRVPEAALFGAALLGGSAGGRPKHDVTFENIRELYEWTSRKALDLAVFKYDEKIISAS